MPGSEKPVEFMLEATRGLSAIDEASLERRYEMDRIRIGETPVPHDDFIRFKATEADKGGSVSYNLYTKADARQQADLLKPAAARIETSRWLENKLRLSLREDPPLLNSKVENLLAFGSTGAKALLAAEADTRSKTAGGLYPAYQPIDTGGTGTLTGEQLHIIDAARATVQIKRFELDKHLLDVERAVHDEVCNKTGEAFANGKIWGDSGFGDLFTQARSTLADFNRRLQDADFELLISTGSIDLKWTTALEGLSNLAEKVRSALAVLLEKAPNLVKAIEENTKGELKDDTPVTNSGLELQLTLIAQEVGQQVLSRIAPSYVATYRIACERPEPAQWPDLFPKMRDAPADEMSTIWLKAAQGGINAVSGTGAARQRTEKEITSVMPEEQKTRCFTFLKLTADQLKQWQTAIKNVSVDGPAKIHGLAFGITNKLRSLEQAMVQAGVQDVSMMPMRSAIDAAFMQLRLDTCVAVELLGGEAT